MRKYIVHMEASAVIGIEVEVEANSREMAASIATERYHNMNGPLCEFVDALMKPSRDAIEGYAKAGNLPVRYAAVMLDKNGFEATDTRLAKPVTPEQVFKAIAARLDGRFDDPDLLAFGELGNETMDIRRILEEADRFLNEVTRQPETGDQTNDE